MGRRWSREKIVEELRGYHEIHKFFSPTDLKRDFHALYSAIDAGRYFESYNDAITAAGIDLTEARKIGRWTDEQIIARIQTIAQNDGVLNAKAVEKKYHQLYHSAESEAHFGSWSNALIAAGIDPSGVRLRKDWDNGRLIRKILSAKTFSGQWFYENMREVYDYARSEHHFHGWNQAVVACMDYLAVTLDAKVDSILKKSSVLEDASPLESDVCDVERGLNFFSRKISLFEERISSCKRSFSRFVRSKRPEIMDYRAVHDGLSRKLDPYRKKY